MNTPVACNPGAELARVVRRHALGWLVAANVVGLWLAADLVWPQLGDLAAPFTYGRWMPLHLNWQLYGWCALPLVGLLLKGMLDAAHPAGVTHARIALGAWSLALALGGVAWLAGVTSGKLFLDWHGWARPVLPLAMVVLWTVLAAHTWWRRRRDAAAAQVARWLGLALLVAVPPVLYWASGRDVYPAVNPDSGGATGASLLGSTLGIVAIFGLLPLLLGRPTCNLIGYKSAGWFWGAWGLSLVGWAVIDHGNASHHAVGQIVGLGLLLAWVPLLAWWWRAHDWSAAGRRWMHAALVWWTVLVGSGWVTFLPGISERLKFTDGLVAHAHLAMAGLVTSVNGLILTELDPARPILRGFGLWQGAAAAHVGVLAVMGWIERDATNYYTGAAWVQVGYGLRLAAGLLMGLASLQWLRETRRA